MIQIEGVPENFVVGVAPLSGKSLKVLGLRDDLIELQTNQLLGVVDFAAYMEEQGIEELVEGTYSVEVMFTLEGEYTQAEPVMVDVIISAPIDEEMSVDI